MNRFFPAVVAPWSTAYAVMLSRALLYTAVTRAERLCVLVGERKAVQMAVGRVERRRRHSTLAERILDELATELMNLVKRFVSFVWLNREDWGKDSSDAFDWK